MTATFRLGQKSSPRYPPGLIVCEVWCLGTSVAEVCPSNRSFVAIRRNPARQCVSSELSGEIFPAKYLRDIFKKYFGCVALSRKSFDQAERAQGRLDRDEYYGDVGRKNNEGRFITPPQDAPGDLSGKRLKATRAPGSPRSYGFSMYAIIIVILIRNSLAWSFTCAHYYRQLHIPLAFTYLFTNLSTKTYALRIEKARERRRDSSAQRNFFGNLC